MAGTGIGGAGLSGVLRLTWVSDHWRTSLEHSQADEPTGTWSDLACLDHGLALGTDVDNAALEHPATKSDIAGLFEELPQTSLLSMASYAKPPSTPTRP